MFMVLYPHVAKKAQEEIDSVVGNERLPTLEDRNALPFIDCIIKEVFRYAGYLACIAQTHLLPCKCQSSDCAR